MTRRLTSQRWHDATYWPLIGASVVWLVAYSWQVIADADGALASTLEGVMVGTWLLFVADYIVRLSLASPRGRWFRRHLFDLAIVVLPMLRALRLLRVFTLVSVLQRTVGTALRSRLTIYGAGAVVLLIYIGSLAVLDAERHAPGANIVSFGDAVWWAFVTITTVGYGDFVPVTVQGRLVAVGLMAGGVAVLGVVTATLSSWVIERAAQGQDDDESATRGQIRALAQQVSQLAERLPEPPGPRS